MANDTWTYLTALGSVAFGWFLNELGQWIRSRKEDKKIKRKALFLLLETHFTFNKFDTSKLLAIITEKVLSRMPQEQRTEEVRQAIKILYKQIISGLIENNVAGNIDDLEETYTKTIEDLALVAPITAYRLKGKNDIFEIFDYLDDYFDSVKNEFPDDAIDIDKHSEKIAEDLKPELIRSALKELEAEIKTIAFSIGLITYYKAKKVIQNTTKSENTYASKQIDKYLEKYST